MTSMSGDDAPHRPGVTQSTSYYTMSDNEDGDETVMHTDSGRGVKLLFSKSKVGFAVL